MPQMIRTLVVDDERYNREELIYLLSQYETIEIIGEADTGEACLVQAMKLQPDLLFLDIEMPIMNGMQAAKALQELRNIPLIVFATAHPQFAVEAFKYEAIDYLLKPYDEEQLYKSIERIKQRLLIEEAPQPTTTGKLPVEANGDVYYLEPTDILYMYRDEKLSRIVSKKGRFESKTPLKELELRLEPFSFFRIHKSYLVNLQAVTRLSPWFNGAYHLELEGVKEQLAVSRNYVKELRKRLEL
ncbi:LytR/AlgR family response regulator transcription factor [Alkalicoccobacillus porphyridii]|uniref:Response regulator transcription factor n=1 Tax=Alkalicoccobacillus porphyridii TaxID=2597270 RepID=A0A554A0R6_9BACI|nr:LytTR family DNA-binding domain-containing protein [Alkalicoccobacillus porphyridii]TSB47287.1 response regulator transcription factor [Alkalicoccobacillus porphyridii]